MLVTPLIILCLFVLPARSLVTEFVDREPMLFPRQTLVRNVLYYAAKYDWPDVACALLARHESTAQEVDGESALHCAVRKGHRKVGRTL